MKKRTAGLVMGLIMGTMAAGMAFGAQAAGITLEDARKAALEAVGLTEEQVIFKEEGKDIDDGREIFEIDFFVAGEVKYDFDIDANTGMILEQDIDLWEADDYFEYEDLIAAAMGGESVMAETETGEITELQAKTIAIRDAGVKADEVTVVKCKKDMDDGVMKFEVKLRAMDGTEYEYDIRISDGMILEKDIDRD